MFKLLSQMSQKAVVFGMDARIAIVIASIAAAALSINLLAVDESEKLQETSYRMIKLYEHVQDYYKNNATDLTELNTIYSASTAAQEAFWGGNNQYKYDAWGNQWYFKVLSENLSINDTSKTYAISCVRIISAGSDGYNYLATTLSDVYANCYSDSSLVTSAGAVSQYDDLFIKFLTHSLVVEKVNIAKEQLEEIASSLELYKNALKSQDVKYCNDLTQTAADANSRCTFGTFSTYEEANLDDKNYFPKSDLDTLINVEYYNDSTVYTSGDQTSMENLMTLLNLPTAYATNGFGDVLTFHSNYANTIAGSFYYEVTYE